MNVCRLCALPTLTPTNAMKGNPNIHDDCNSVVVVCMYCKKTLKGDRLTAAMVSHGLCNPLCKEAIEKGWEPRARLTERAD